MTGTAHRMAQLVPRATDLMAVVPGTMATGNAAMGHGAVHGIRRSTKERRAPDAGARR